MNFNKNYTWDVDQHIVSTEHKNCRGKFSVSFVFLRKIFASKGFVFNVMEPNTVRLGNVKKINWARNIFTLIGNRICDFTFEQVSRSLLESKSCSLPQDNKLWQEVNLEPSPFRYSKYLYQNCYQVASFMSWRKVENACHEVTVLEWVSKFSVV
jgi:hypothetical protein